MSREEMVALAMLLCVLLLIFRNGRQPPVVVQLNRDPKMPRPEFS